MGKISEKVAIIVIVLAILLILLSISIPCLRPLVVGGAVVARSRQRIDFRKSKHVIVDTLNFTHWRNKRTEKKSETITRDDIIRTIDESSPELCKRFPGRVMYVLKDRESALNDAETRVIYANAAKRNNVYIYVVERYEDPPKSSLSETALLTHSARGRDDFYMGVLARRWKAPVLTEDRFRDFDQLRGSVKPFHTYEFTFHRSLPERDFINPAAAGFRTLHRPPSIRYESMVS